MAIAAEQLTAKCMSPGLSCKCFCHLAVTAFQTALPSLGKHMFHRQWTCRLCMQKAEW
jgi:hypothetical protein